MLTLTFALSIAVAPPPCPVRDAPAPPDVLALQETRAALVVDEAGVGHLTLTLALENTGDRAAMGEWSLGGDEAAPVVVRARLKDGLSKRRARLDDAEPARETFEAFVDALSFGVEPEEARPGRERAALLVEERDGAPMVRVAAACSVRKPRVEIRALLDGESTKEGLRFVVPAPAVRAAIDVDARGAAVFVDGARRRHHARDAASLFGEGRADETPPFVVVVERERGIVARGGVVALTPRTARATDDDEGTAEAEADDEPLAPFSLAHAALSLPRVLAPIPPELRVVFVVDTSVSVGEQGVARTLALVRAIVDALPDDARFAIVTSSRAPHVLVPPWRAKNAGDFAMPVVENGSNLDLAIARARAIAEDALPGSGRVVVLSDLAFASGHEPRVLRAIAPADRAPLVHVVSLPDGLDDETRGLLHTRVARGAGTAFDDALVERVERTGGVFLVVEPSADDDRALARHLVTPTTLDHLTLTVDGAELDVLPSEGSGALREVRVVRTGDGSFLDALPEVLAAGDGVRASVIVDGRARRVALSGALWGARVDLPLTSSADIDTLWLAHIAAGRTTLGLFASEVRAAAHAGRFVSSETSLVDVPSWRPAVSDDARFGAIGCRGGSISCRCGGGHTRCGIGHASHIVSRAQEIVDEAARFALEHCRVERVRARIEVMDHEILSLEPGDNARVDRCVEDALWSVRLDRRSDPGFAARATFEIDVSAVTSTDDDDASGIENDGEDDGRLVE